MPDYAVITAQQEPDVRKASFIAMPCELQAVIAAGVELRVRRLPTASAGSRLALAATQKDTGANGNLVCVLMRA